MFTFLVSSLGRAVFQCNAWLNFQLVTAHLREAEEGKKECRRALEYLKYTFHFSWQAFWCEYMFTIGQNWLSVGHSGLLKGCVKLKACFFGTTRRPCLILSLEDTLNLIWVASYHPQNPYYVVCIFYGHFLMLEMQRQYSFKARTLKFSTYIESCRISWWPLICSGTNLLLPSCCEVWYHQYF